MAAPHRFFLSRRLSAGDPSVPVELPLEPADIHHAGRAARLRAGESVIVVAPDGIAHEVCLTDVTPRGIMGTIVGSIETALEPHVVLAQGMVKGPAFDLVVEKAIEVGVAGIVPVAFARSVVRLDEAKAAARAARWRRIARSAAMQSHRAFVPEVAEPIAADALAALVPEFDVVLVAWEEAAGAPGIGAALRDLAPGDGARVAVVVGPEGGLAESEVRTLCEAGAAPVGLGETVLRSETAGIVAAALCVYELGGLGGRRSVR